METVTKICLTFTTLTCLCLHFFFKVFYFYFFIFTFLKVFYFEIISYLHKVGKNETKNFFPEPEYCNVEFLQTRKFSYITECNHQNKEINTDAFLPSSFRCCSGFDRSWSLQQKPSSGSPVVFRCPVSHFFHSECLLSLSLTFTTLILLNVTF